MNKLLALLWRALLAVVMPVQRAFINSWQMGSRFVKIALPFWLPNGWRSAPAWIVLAAATVASYFGLQKLAASMTPITNFIVEALSGGYLHFAYAYAAPALVGVAAFAWVCKKFWPKNEHTQGMILLYLLLLLMLGVNVLNVVLNFANGAIMNAMNHKDQAQFMIMVIRLLACFVIGTFVVVLYSYVRNKFTVTWRKWLTEHLLTKYFQDRNYYKINQMSDVDNPDERMANDVDAFVTGAASLVLAFLGGIMTFFSFMPILKEVDPTGSLTWIAYVWSAGFTLLAFGFGRKLVGLNFNQSRYEADFRYSLIHVRNNTEAIAFYRGEEQEKGNIRLRFSQVVQNFSNLIGWNRNLGFIQTGSDYFTVAIPFLVLGPLYFAGTVEMGNISQASMAFGQVLSALTIIVTEFRTLSVFTANINRLAGFVEALEAPDISTLPGHTSIENKPSAKITVDNVTLMTPDWSRMLVRDLTVNVDQGQGLVVMGPSGSGKSSLLKMLAGLWHAGKGTVSRPGLEDMMFLPQRPYMPQGSLRDQLLYPKSSGKSDAELQKALELVNLPDLAKHHGGFDKELRWADVLSLGEQQRVAFARLILAAPHYAILDEATSALDVQNEEHLYGLLRKSGLTFVSVGHRPSLVKYHSQVLTLVGDGNWRVLPSDKVGQ